jgi:hypothetical protein
MVEEVTERPTYTARAERDGPFWFARVEGVPGALVQARRLDQVVPRAREVLGMLLEVPEASLDVRLEVDLTKMSPEAEEAVRKTVEARRRAELESVLSSSLMRTTTKMLASAGLTVRDIGEVLGISHQRAAQLLATPGHSKWSEVKRQKGA